MKMNEESQSGISMEMKRENEKMEKSEVLVGYFSVHSRILYKMLFPVRLKKTIANRRHPMPVFWIFLYRRRLPFLFMLDSLGLFISVYKHIQLTHHYASFGLLSKTTKA